MDRGVVEAFREMPERDRYVRGMIHWLGFKQTSVSSTARRVPRAKPNIISGSCCASP